jgi:2-desacetyl-2-hydroxyethyl bacteriochlorophyllide A dehydrogenase
VQAVTFEGPGQVELKDVPQPQIEEPSDALVRITMSAICGTDMQMFGGRIPVPAGAVLGHEFVGIVEEVGSAVQRLRAGQRIVSPFSTSCGDCYYCRTGLLTMCLQRQFFGFGQIGGAQAQWLRVPMAESTVELLPDEISDQQAVFLSDVLPGALASVEGGGIKAGDVVAVVGCGPTGLCAQLCAHLFGPAAVLAVDHHAYRLAKAKELGSIAIDFDHEDAAARVRDYSEGRGADVVVEAVGKAEALSTALELLRPWGTLVTMGIFMEPSFELPLRDFNVRHLTWRASPVPPVKNYMPRLISLVVRGRLDPSPIVSHVLPLEEAPRGYQLMADREDEALKVLLKP